MSADGDRGLVGLREALRRTVDDLKGHLVHVLHELHVESALALKRIGLLQALRKRGVAADPDAEAADGPEQELDVALDKAVIGLGQLGRPVDLGMADGDLPAVALKRDGQGLFRTLLVGVEPHAEGDEILVQHGQMFDRIVDSQIIHCGSSVFMLRFLPGRSAASRPTCAPYPRRASSAHGRGRGCARGRQS